MPLDAEIAVLSDDAQTISALADILVETVAAGGSVSFMHPLAPERARSFWRDSLAAVGRGERAVLGAWVSDVQSGRVLAGTVTLQLACPENQPHRAEIAKLMTRPGHRGCGVGGALMRRAERIAAGRGKTLITLDTAAEEGAGAFYERLGYQRAGVIPDYALKPHGGLVATVIYYKRIGGG